MARGHCGFSDSSHPPAKPAFRNPRQMYGMRRMSFHGRPVRWFSIIMTIGP
jgi:hypothetical protein